jgi:hypothetical protein
MQAAYDAGAACIDAAADPALTEGTVRALCSWTSAADCGSPAQATLCAAMACAAACHVHTWAQGTLVDVMRVAAGAAVPEAGFLLDRALQAARWEALPQLVAAVAAAPCWPPPPLAAAVRRCLGTVCTHVDVHGAAVHALVRASLRAMGAWVDRGWAARDPDPAGTLCTVLAAGHVLMRNQSSRHGGLCMEVLAWVGARCEFARAALHDAPPPVWDWVLGVLRDVLAWGCGSPMAVPVWGVFGVLHAALPGCPRRAAQLAAVVLPAVLVWAQAAASAVTHDADACARRGLQVMERCCLWLLPVCPDDALVMGVCEQLLGANPCADRVLKTQWSHRVRAAHCTAVAAMSTCCRP